MKDEIAADRQGGKFLFELVPLPPLGLHPRINGILIASPMKNGVVSRSRPVRIAAPVWGGVLGF